MNRGEFKLDETNRMVVIRQAPPCIGFGDGLGDFITEHGFINLDSPMKEIGVLNTSAPLAPRLENSIQCVAERAIDVIKSFL